MGPVQNLQFFKILTKAFKKSQDFVTEIQVPTLKQ